MSSYTSITIIYNPNSKGNSERLAKDLRNELKEKLAKPEIDLVATTHAGHGETLAYKLAKASKRPLIISSSGDGGYNDVINGIMLAIKEGAMPVAGLLPAGNANDHHKAMHEDDLVNSIAEGKTSRIDLLKLDYTHKAQRKTKYAHSYIGFGLTPKAGKKLNEHNLNFLIESWLVLKVVLRLKPIQLIINGETKNYDSLIFSNIGNMSKILSLSDISKVNDGKFEITPFRKRNKVRLIAILLKASVRGLRVTRQSKEFEFKTTEPLLGQLDGEIVRLDPYTKALISMEPLALECVV